MFCLHRKLKSNSVTIHKNLIVAIFIAELTFLVGINRTEDQVNSSLKQLSFRFRSIISFLQMVNNKDNFFRHTFDLTSVVFCLLFFAENLQADRYCAALLLQRIFFVDVRRRTAHVSQTQRKEEH